MEFNSVENMETGESQKVFMPPPLPSESVSANLTENLSALVQSHDDSMESVAPYSHISHEVSMPVPLPVVRLSQPESLSENLSTPVQSSSQNESMESLTFAGLPERPVLYHRQQPPLAPPPPPIGGGSPSPVKGRSSSQVIYYSEQVVYPVEESGNESMAVEPLPAHRHVTHVATTSSDDSVSE